MKRRTNWGIVTAIVIAGCAPSAVIASTQMSHALESAGFHGLTPSGKLGLDTPAFWVRPGYKVTRVANDLGEARFLEKDDNGNIYLSQPNAGTITMLKPTGNKLKVASTFVRGHKSVHGMCWVDGWLYYSKSGEIRRAQDTNGDGTADKDERLLGPDEYSRGGGHWWRSVLVTKDAIYTGIGDSQNINDELEGPRQKIWKFKRDGTDPKEYCGGLRNTEKLLLRPGTNEIWGMDHGSDNWGQPLGEQPGIHQPITDLNPPDEFNHYEQGKFYGHPFLMGNRIPRYEYKDRKDLLDIAARTEPPEWSFGPHWAMNGFCFLTSKRFGASAPGNAICAAHGSWNSIKKVGYRVEQVMFDAVTGKPYGSLAIVSTLSKTDEVLARPVDCLEMKDGSVLFSCDLTASLYRIEPDGATK